MGTLDRSVFYESQVFAYMWHMAVEAAQGVDLRKLFSHISDEDLIELALRPVDVLMCSPIYAAIYMICRHTLVEEQDWSLLHEVDLHDLPALWEQMVTIALKRRVDLWMRELANEHMEGRRVIAEAETKKRVEACLSTWLEGDRLM